MSYKELDNAKKRVCMSEDMWNSVFEDLQDNVFIGGKTSMSFVTANGQQVDVAAFPRDIGTEMYAGGISIREGTVGGKSSLLYEHNSIYDDRYPSEVAYKGYQSFHAGKFDSVMAVAEDLATRYKDVEFMQTNKFLQPDYDEKYERVWENTDYASELRREEKFQSYSSYDDDDIKRLVWQDKGEVTMSDGRKGHAVDFAYACDQMTFGQDSIMPNPYLRTTKSFGQNGKTSHEYLVPDDMFQRLSEVSGAGGGRWTGVFESVLEKKTSDKGYTSVYPDLSNMAEEAGVLRMPDVAFDVDKHDSFVKQSLKQRSSARNLPQNVPVDAKTIESETQFE